MERRAQHADEGAYRGSDKAHDSFLGQWGIHQCPSLVATREGDAVIEERLSRNISSVDKTKVRWPL
jgi:hypothetical protein